MFRLRTASLCALVLVLSACSSDKESKSSASPQLTDAIISVSSENLPDFVVSQHELDLMVERMGGVSALVVGGDAFTEKLKQSLVVSKAMALSAIQGMSASELQKIDLKAQQYREELLVKAWVQRNAIAQPPSVSEVSEYYQNNLTDFGYKKIRSIEILVLTPPGSNQDQIKIMKDLVHVKESHQWETLIQRFNEQSVAYSRKSLKIDLTEVDTQQKSLSILPKQVLLSTQQLEPGDVSQVIVADGQWYKVNVKDEKEISPKSLAEVSGDIRKRLAPIKFRESVKALSDQLYSSLDVKPLD